MSPLKISDFFWQLGGEGKVLQGTRYDPEQILWSEDVLGDLSYEDLVSLRPSSKESKGQDVMQKNEANFSFFMKNNLMSPIFTNHLHHR